jgi:cytochrome c biogenesis protein CcmG/thiol:disulfide interchange protein DsbE
MRQWKLFLPLGVFLVLAVLFWRGLQLDPEYMPSALVDRPVPSFQLPDLLSGELLDEAVLYEGPTLVNIWATWCPSCYVEHPYLNELAARGVRIVGINYKDDDTKARAWLAEKGNPYAANIVDADGMLGLDFGVTGAPETYLVDAEGVIRFRHQGPMNEQVWQRDFLPLMPAGGDLAG